MNLILDAFEAACQSVPERLATADQSLMLDYRSLRAVACGLSRQISERAKSPNVGILVPTSAAGTCAVLGCWYAGKTPVPLNFLLAPEEIGRIIRDAGLDLVMTIEHFAPVLAAAGVPTLLLDAKSLVPGQVAAPDAAPNDTAVIIYTSGTTGDCKGACLSFSNVHSNAMSCVEHARITPDQAFLNVLPQFHSFGFTVMTALPLMIGATVWSLPRFTPLMIATTIAEKQISIFIAVASMYGALVKLKNVEGGSLKSLKLAIAGGEPLPRNIAQAFAAKFAMELMEGYGLTETSPVVSTNVPWANRVGSVGRPLPGVTVSAVDEQGRGLPAGMDGELHIGGAGVMKGYFNKPEATALALAGGVMHTGDIGHVDADGYIFITGRAKEMLIVGGENVFPREIEDVLIRHPAVAEAAVVGSPDPLRGEVPVAFVVLQADANSDSNELRSFCRERLAGYKAPREVRIVMEMPRGPTGKVLKKQLAATL